jgi:hypothetical protein
VLTYQLFVPCLIWTINAERRMHRSERAKRVAQIRNDTFWLAGAAPRFDVPVEVHFLPYQ